MKIEGIVSRSQEVKKGDKTYHNLSVEGFSLIPGQALTSFPVEGQTIKGTVQVYWPKKGDNGSGRPLHFLSYWEPA